MIDYDDFVNGRLSLNDVQPHDIWYQPTQALYKSLDPILILMIAGNLYSAYQMDKNGKNKWVWLTGVNVMNVYLFNLIAARHN